MKCAKGKPRVASINARVLHFSCRLEHPVQLIMRQNVNWMCLFRVHKVE